jgi:NTE family protein
MKSETIKQLKTVIPLNYGQKDPGTTSQLLLHGAIRLFLVFLLLLWVLNATSQSHMIGESRPTVALVLSGGGAKGVAHIGVIRALEENGIPIDYVAGTSMGAIIGGLYAAGYSPDEMERMIFSEGFAKASIGEIDKKYDFYYFHHDPNPAWVSIKFGRDQILNYQDIIRANIPANIVSPGPMDFMFMETFAPASSAANNDFDNLMVPFRCVASDVVENKAVVLRNGNLAEAIRASMTFPLYFRPITIDGRLMFDGGMYNNFPVDVAQKDFNPDIIIGSVVSANPNPPCPDDIVSQLENMLMAKLNYKEPDINGIIFYPDVPGLNVTDFSRSEDVLSAGYNSVNEKIDEIRSKVERVECISVVTQKRQNFRSKFPAGYVGRINVISEETIDARFIYGPLSTRKAFLPLDDIRKYYFQLLASNKFRHIYPRLNFDHEQNYYELELEIIRNPVFTREFGGNISSKSINQFYGKFSYDRFYKSPLTIYSNLFLGNYYNSMKAGIRIDFPSEKPFYFLAESTFSRWNYTTGGVFFFEEQKPSFIRQREFLNDLRFVFPTDYKGKIETGMFFTSARNRFYNYNYFEQSDEPDISKINPLGLYFAIEQNTLNRFQYPTNGSFFHLSARYLLANEIYTPGSTALSNQEISNDHQWWEILMQWENFFMRKQKVRFSLIAETFFSNRPVLSNYSATKILASQYNPFPLASTKYLDLFRSNNYLAVGLRTTYCFSRRWHLQAESHVFHDIKRIVPDIGYTASYKKGFSHPVFMHHGALVYHTGVGPLSAGISYFEGENNPWVFMLNFGYVLFNRRTF